VAAQLVGRLLVVDHEDPFFGLHGGQDLGQPVQQVRPLAGDRVEDPPVGGEAVVADADRVDVAVGAQDLDAALVVIGEDPDLLAAHGRAVVAHVRPAGPDALHDGLAGAVAAEAMQPDSVVPVVDLQRAALVVMGWAPILAGGEPLGQPVNVGAQLAPERVLSGGRGSGGHEPSPVRGRMTVVLVGAGSVWDGAGVVSGPVRCLGNGLVTALPAPSLGGAGPAGGQGHALHVGLT
jgi:hypothetical protein